MGPPKKDHKEIFICSYFDCKMSGSIKQVFGFFLGVLEGLGSSGRLIGTISTYHGTSLMLGS